MNRYLTHSKAAEYLRLSKDGLYWLGRRRRVPYGRWGKALIYDKVNLDQWIELCRRNADHHYFGSRDFGESKMPRYLTHKLASQYLGLNEGTLYKLFRKKEIPVGRRGKTLIYDRNKLDKWVDSCHKVWGVTLMEAVQRDRKKGGAL